MSDQPTGSYSPSHQPVSTSIFGTKVPSSVTFTVAVLLFFLPFAELKCKAPQEKENSFINLSSMSASLTNTGLGLALGSDWKANMSMGGLFNNQHENDWKKDRKPLKPNSYAIVALVLAILGLGLSFTATRAWAAVGAATGVLSAAAMIGLMIDLQRQSKDLVSETQKAGNSLNITEGSGFILSFTPWFFIAVVALIVAAFFSYKRMQLIK